LHRRHPSFQECAQNPTDLLDVRVASRLARQDPDIAALGNLHVSRVDQPRVSGGSRIPRKRSTDPPRDRNGFVPVHLHTVLEQLGDRERGRPVLGFVTERNNTTHR
jgi:hypothetical protein